MPNKRSDDIFEKSLLRLDLAANFSSIESESLEPPSRFCKFPILSEWTMDH